MVANALNSILRLYLNKRYRRIQNLHFDSSYLQNKIFKHLITQAKQTQFGKAHDFDQINEFSDYQKSCPLVDYNGIKDSIFRMMHGEPNLLWPGVTKYFSKSSGTTEEQSKYIPVSNQMIQENFRASGWDASSCIYHHLPHANIAGKKNLLMGGSLQPFAENRNTKVGDVSAIMIDHLPAISKYWYTPSFDIALMDKWEQKIKLMAAQIINEDVFLFGGVPTWTMVLFNEMLRITGKENILEIWPNAKIYGHGGVGFEPYRKEFERYLPDADFLYMESFNASEGYFGVQDCFDRDELLLFADHGVFYEFLPVDASAPLEQKTVLLEDIQIGQVYEMVLSTVAGLWRYRLGDTVTFTSKNPFRYKISGRTKQYINVFGEEVMIADTDKALAMACNQLGVEIRDYTVAPIFMGNENKGGHEWLIEFKKQPSSLDAFQRTLDDCLQSVNSDYQAKRYKNMALQNLIVEPTPRGAFDTWLKRKGKFGNQHKVPRLSCERTYVDEIKTVIQDLNGRR